MESIHEKLGSCSFVFQGLEEFERQKVADAMEPKKFSDGEMIIRQVNYKPYLPIVFLGIFMTENFS